MNIFVSLKNIARKKRVVVSFNDTFETSLLQYIVIWPLDIV